MQNTSRLQALGKALKRRLGLLFKMNRNRFLKEVSGVIHVGANTGQEINLYAQYGLSVVWVEPIPEIFEKLQANLKGVHGQIALQSLVTDIDNVEYRFHLANNDGASSSILELNLHRDIWPDIEFEKTITVLSKTLTSLLKDNHINESEYDMLVIDTQGSELLVLKGALPILHHFTFIQTEVPDFEAYKGCCQLKDLQEFLGRHGYREKSREKFATHADGGSYYDIIYKKIPDAMS
jgi:FkbM family methyltransferase